MDQKIQPACRATPSIVTIDRSRGGDHRGRSDEQGQSTVTVEIARVAGHDTVAVVEENIAGLEVEGFLRIGSLFASVGPGRDNHRR